MQLSERLRAVAALVMSGGTVADIGTDHAYIPIYLIQTDAVSRAIAMDVNPGPLSRAREHIAQYGLESEIETRLSDGLAALRPGEADSVVIAGMGGALMRRILEEGRDRLDGASEQTDGRCNSTAALSDSMDNCADSQAEHRGKRRGCRELILQPQSEIWLVRAWLERSGWRIVREDMVREDGKYYPMMRAERCKDKNESNKPCSDKIHSDKIDSDKTDSDEAVGTEKAAARPGLGLTEMELRFGPLLLRERHPVLREFLLHEKELDLRILASLNGQTGEAAVARAKEVRGELRLAEEALDLLRV